MVAVREIPGCFIITIIRIVEVARVTRIVRITETILDYSVLFGLARITTSIGSPSANYQDILITTHC